MQYICCNFKSTYFRYRSKGQRDHEKTTKIVINHEKIDYFDRHGQLLRNEVSKFEFVSVTVLLP